MKTLVLFTIINFQLLALNCFAQQTKIDSLLTLLEKDKDDTSKVNHLNALGRLLMYQNPDTAIALGNQALAIITPVSTLEFGAGKAGMEKKEIRAIRATTLGSLGVYYFLKSDYPNAIDYYLKALKIDEELKNKKGMVARFGNIGNVYCVQGDYPKALDFDFKALKMAEELQDKKAIADNYIGIGIVYHNQEDFPKSVDYFFKALKIAEELNNKNLIEVILGNIGIAFNEQGDYPQALDYYFKALKMAETLENKHGIARHFINIGLVYYWQGVYPKAFDYYFKALKMNEELGNKYATAITLGNIGSLCTVTGKFKEAEQYLKKAIALDDSIGAIDRLSRVEELLSQLYDTTAQLAIGSGNYSKAAEDYRLSMLHYKKSAVLQDSLFSQEKEKQLVQKEMNFEFDKKETATQALHDKAIALQEADMKRQKVVIWSVAGGFVLMIVLAFFIYRGYRQKKNANKLLEEKNILIEKQKQLVEEKNLKITDSINYAKRIQHSIFPTRELIKAVLPDSFVFFRPKDIVSGDFYWISEKNGKLLIAVADCTGHGVPGAFMSMIGNTLLNEIVNVKNISEPGQILNHLNKGIINILHQNNSETNTQDDGMDITILAIDKTNNEVEFAGANHFAYLIKVNELKTLKGDVFSIGGMFWEEDVKFSSQKIKIEKGDTFYLFTDGFIDQFGGEKNSKFLSRRFEQLLQNIQQPDMEQQAEKLITAFDDWKGNNKQLDDVCVIGIRI